MAVVLGLVLEGAGAEGLLLTLGEVLCCGTEGLGRKHRSVCHGQLAGVVLELGAVGLHLLAGELLVEEHVSDAVLCGDVVVELAVE